MLLVAVLALSAPASADDGTSPCDPQTSPFNECGFNCQPGSGYYLCNNVVEIGACVMLTLHQRPC